MKKVVIITGASRGFGELIAKKFQKENFQVIATMRNIDSSPSCLLYTSPSPRDRH